MSSRGIQTSARRVRSVSLGFDSAPIGLRTRTPASWSSSAPKRFTRRILFLLCVLEKLFVSSSLSSSSPSSSSSRREEDAAKSTASCSSSSYPYGFLSSSSAQNSASSSSSSPRLANRNATTHAQSTAHATRLLSCLFRRMGIAFLFSPMMMMMHC